MNFGHLVLNEWMEFKDFKIIKFFFFFFGSEATFASRGLSIFHGTGVELR